MQKASHVVLAVGLLLAGALAPVSARRVIHLDSATIADFNALWRGDCARLAP